jgi:hypothetical protein
MNKTIKFLALATVMAIPSMAQAARRVVLQYNDTVFRTRTGADTLHLKQKLRNQHGINASRFNLLSAKLVAKSRRGGGEARLKVGQNTSRWKRVTGHQDDWNVRRPRTFDRVEFTNRRRSNGVWQIKMQGRIKVRKVVLSIERKRGPGPRPGGPISFTSVGNERFDKLRNETERYQVNIGNVRQIRFRADRNKLQLDKVVIYFANGTSVNARQLDGSYRNNEVKVMRLNGRRVTSIKVTGRTPSLRGSRARLYVDVGRR